MFIRFRNGSTWQVVGSDNYNSLVGSPPVGVVFSEWALARPEAWTYMRPILAENGGWAVFIWTPRGRNHATTAFDARARSRTWFTLKASATETGVFSAEQLAKEKAELIAESGSVEEGTAKYEQEYEVNFDAATPGAYYASLINDAEKTGRITRPVRPGLRSTPPGTSGSTTTRPSGSSSRSAARSAPSTTSRPPATGCSPSWPRPSPASPTSTAPPPAARRHGPRARRGRKEPLRDAEGLGVMKISVGCRARPEERINASRLMIPMTWFDAEKCALGLNRLRAYRKRWNRSTSSYTGPLHDENSHGADAFGEFAVNRARPDAPGERRWRARGGLGRREPAAPDERSGAKVGGRLDRRRAVQALRQGDRGDARTGRRRRPAQQPDLRDQPVSGSQDDVEADGDVGSGGEGVMQTKAQRLRTLAIQAYWAARTPIEAKMAGILLDLFAPDLGAA
jgi:phage terminase large subunit